MRLAWSISKKQFVYFFYYWQNYCVATQLVVNLIESYGQILDQLKSVDDLHSSENAIVWQRMALFIFPPYPLSIESEDVSPEDSLFVSLIRILM